MRCLDFGYSATLMLGTFTLLLAAALALLLAQRWRRASA